MAVRFCWRHSGGVGWRPSGARAAVRDVVGWLPWPWPLQARNHQSMQPKSRQLPSCVDIADEKMQDADMQCKYGLTSSRRDAKGIFGTKPSGVHRQTNTNNKPVSFCDGKEDFMDCSNDDTDDDQEENGDLHPLPRTEDIERRSTAGSDDGRAAQLRRKPTLDSVSLASFGSERTVDSRGAGEIGDLVFIADEEMPPGQSSVLGKGSFATVRLARRRKSRLRRSSVVSELSFESPYAHDTNPAAGGQSHGCLLSERSTIDSDADEGQLVAVKIIEKSLLSKVKTMYRDGENQLQCSTALENVEREIAVMKLLGCTHPNLVSLLEVIDTGPGSNRLYMVLEYVPLGELLSHVKGTDRYERKWQDGEPRPSIAMSDGYFTEYQSALFFVDVMHGLATLHKNRIAHRDLKPENILLDERGFVKISDFGVSHLFEDDMPGLAPKPRKLTLSYTSSDEGLEKSLKHVDSEFASKMKSMSSLGKLTKTEGTWAYWSVSKRRAFFHVVFA